MNQGIHFLNLYEIENGKNYFASKIKEIERNFLELEENNEYKGIKNVKYLFDLITDEQ